MDENADLETSEDDPITGVFFDGRVDQTKNLLEDDNGKKYPSTRSEEHVTMTCEPGGMYIGHLSPDAKDAKTQSSELNDFFVENNIDKSLLFLGGDSTPVNTGPTGGIMYLLEVLLGRRLVRTICELHTNELPLRHIIEKLDGPTSGANSFSGKFSVCLY